MIFMKKSTLKVVSVLGTLAICLTAFAACSGEDNSQKLLYEEGGKIYYREEIGDIARELATDSNGVTLVDEEGNLLWKITDEDGSEHTHAVSFPGYLEDGKKVSCQQFSMTMPKGWKNIGHGVIMLRDKTDSIKIDYTFFGEEDGKILSAEERLEGFKNLFAPNLEDGTAKMEVSDVQVAGRDAKKAKLTTTGDKEVYLEIYLIDIPVGVMAFTCTTDFEDGREYDFKPILDTIEYRI